MTQCQTSIQRIDIFLNEKTEIIGHEDLPPTYDDISNESRNTETPKTPMPEATPSTDVSVIRRFTRMASDVTGHTRRKERKQARKEMDDEIHYMGMNATLQLIADRVKSIKTEDPEKYDYSPIQYAKGIVKMALQLNLVPPQTSQIRIESRSDKLLYGKPLYFATAWAMDGETPQLIQRADSGGLDHSLAFYQLRAKPINDGGVIEPEEESQGGDEDTFNDEERRWEWERDEKKDLTRRV